jgi:hypothetical protein
MYQADRKARSHECKLCQSGAVVARSARSPRDQQLEKPTAERLLTEIDPGRVYPTTICASALPISGRPFANTKLSGEQASHDLRLFVEDLTMPPPCRPTGRVKRF